MTFNNNQNDNIPIIQLLWMVFISFFCAFSKELNNYAKEPPKKRNFLLFISGILLSGVCGVLVGLIIQYMFKSMYITTFFSGVGGILGVQFLKSIIKVFFKMKDIAIKLDEEENHNKRKSAKNKDKQD